MKINSSTKQLVHLLMSIAILIGLLYWLFSTADKNFEALDQRGLHSYAIVTSIGWKQAYLSYWVNGEEYSYVKTINSPNSPEAQRLEEGDTLEVTYLPDDPNISWISLSSWENFRNR